MSQLFEKVMFIAVFIGSLWAMDSVHAQDTSTACASLTHHPTIGSSQGHISTPSERLCFTTEIPAAGLWLIDAGVDPSFSADARLDVVGSACDPHADASTWRLLGRSADSAVVEVGSAGRYSFCVAGRDPGAVVGLQVRSSFAGFSSSDWPDATCTDPLGCPPPPTYDPEHEPDPDPLRLAGGASDATCTNPLGCPPPPTYDPEHEPDPDPLRLGGGLADTTCTNPLGCPPPPTYDPEHEPDPDPFRWIDAPCLGSSVRIADVGDTTCTNPLGCPPPPTYDPEHEPDPDPFRLAGGLADTTCTNPLGCPPPPTYDPEHEPDPDPVLIAGSCRQAETLRRACDRLLQDDHADLEVCASTLATGDVREGRVAADDVDVFRLDVTTWRTVRLVVDGGVDGVVYNRDGHRLGTLDAMDASGLVEMLAPGSYYVHLRGEGAYRLGAVDVGGLGGEIVAAF